MKQIIKVRVKQAKGFSGLVLEVLTKGSEYEYYHISTKDNRVIDIRLFNSKNDADTISYKLFNTEHTFHAPSITTSILNGNIVVNIPVMEMVPVEVYEIAWGDIS